MKDTHTHTKHNLQIRCGERIRSVMSLVCKMISLKNIELRFLYIFNLNLYQLLLVCYNNNNINASFF